MELDWTKAATEHNTKVDQLQTYVVQSFDPMKLMFDNCYRWSILRRVEILPSSISQPSGTSEWLCFLVSFLSWVSCVGAKQVCF